jgi:molybdate-binding protein
MGCDPALGILAARLAEGAAPVRLVWLEGGSGRALDALDRGHVHLAGAHLFDPRARRWNGPGVVARGGARAMATVRFARWEQGLVLRRGLGRRVRSVRDVARAGLRLVNREPGAGARALLDRLLAEARIPPEALPGYDQVAPGHAAVGQAVALGAADAGVAVASVARAFDLDFVPLSEERFDLVGPLAFFDTPSGRRIVDVLGGRTFRRELAALDGYDPRDAGAVEPVAAGSLAM